MGQFEEYSAIYDLIYKDKDYAGEVSYIHHILRNLGKSKSKLLDAGCGTGRHSGLLADIGYSVCGIDRSDAMLEIARKHHGDKISFFSADIRDFDLNIEFDVVISLFHVMSYQITNEDVNRTFQSVYKHLKKGGLFLFDCWYGPGIMNDPPVIRIKKASNNEYEVIRLSEPHCNYNESLIEVNFNSFIKDKKADNYRKISESHKMRFFFKNEIELFAAMNGYELKNYYSWLGFDVPKDNEWYSLFVLQK